MQGATPTAVTVFPPTPRRTGGAGRPGTVPPVRDEPTDGREARVGLAPSLPSVAPSAHRAVTGTIG
ncbi:hypothetical protein ASF23_15490 [Curtobacterium sp. Leaf261]|nr:hypothetical protein ASF23_15490 [Curtobacterium sp. Leaf261]